MKTEYTAFISYSHSADAVVAAALQKELYRFAKPWYRRRMIRIFRDKTSLAASPALWASLEKALASSEYLILVASPKSAGSPWIEREVTWWIENRSSDKVLIVLTSGNILWDENKTDFDWQQTNALPAALKGRFAGEPLYVDVSWTAGGSSEALSPRNARFRGAILDLASVLRGISKDELDGDDLRQHRRTRRLAWSAGTALFLLATAFGLAAWYATQQRDLAVARNVAARSSLAVAEGDIELGGLLAVESIRARPSLESDNAIRRALDMLAVPVATVDFAEQVTDVDIDGPGHFVLIAGEERLARWDSRTGAIVDLLPQMRIESATIARVGGRVLATDPDGKVFVWGARDMRMQAPTAERMGTARLSRDGRWAVLVDVQGRTYRWDVDGGKVEHLPAPESESLRGGRAAAAISPDGSQVVVGYARTLRVWQSGRLVSDRIPPDEWRATDVEISPDATRVAAYDLRTKLMEIRDAASGTLIGRLATGASLGTFYTSETGSRVILYGNTSHTMAVWDVDSRRLISAANEYNVLYKNLAISGDGNRLAATSNGGMSVRVWDVRQEQILNLGDEDIGQVRVSSAGGDGKRVLIRDKEGQIRLVDTSTGQRIWEWNESMPTKQAKLGADGGHILAVKADGQSVVLRVDAEPGGQPVAFEETADLIALGADGKRALAVSQDSAGVFNFATARIWDPLTGALLETVPVQGRVFWAALSSEGDRLVLGDRQSLWTWRLGGWFRQNRDFDIGREISATAVSPDGSLLAVVSGENILEVWDIARREQVLHLAGQHALETIGFSVDGRSLLLISRSPQGIAARRLLLPPEDLIVEVCARVARDLNEQEWLDYVGVGGLRPTCPKAAS